MYGFTKSMVALTAGLLLLTLNGPFHPSGLARAATAGAGPTSTWQKQDTAVYVVSTLHLLRTTANQPASVALQRAGVATYSVYADRLVQNLFVITLNRADGQTLAALIYRLGWTVPRSVVAHPLSLATRLAGHRIARIAMTDPRDLLQTFTSLGGVPGVAL